MFLTYLEQTKAIYDEMVENRRYLHQHPELGFDLPVTSAYVRKQLESYGYEVKTMLEYGLIVELGKPGKTLLLRADMDALPMGEETGLPYASKTEGQMHACGHDIHTTIMLAVAKVLKENEDKLEGTIRIEFQPAEELLIGSEKMVEAGLLEGVDGAMAAHVMPTFPTGLYFSEGISMAGANNYEITVKGQSCHGAMPFTGIDPVLIATQIINAFSHVISREVPFNHSATITTGGFESPGSRNIIPDEIRMEGTMRTLNNETREYLKKRMPEVAEGIAKVYRGEVEFNFLSNVPALVNDPKTTRDAKASAEKAVNGEIPVTDFEAVLASEDFAFVTDKVPSTYFFIGMEQEGVTPYPVHHPKVQFNEEMMPYVAAVFCQAAQDWFHNN